ncbi:MAG: ATP-dependent helicase HrpB [Myxococcaceae bacterium]
MAQKAGEAQPTGAPNSVQATQAAQATQKTQDVRQVEQVAKSEKSSLNRVNANVERATTKAADPVGAKSETSKATDAMMKMMSDLEKGQGVLDKLISGGLSGKEFSSSELLALQAGMYKYTQELELTGKVVEKATSGLKDTLKTQV